MGAEDGPLKDFYSNIFGWNPQPYEGVDNYHVVSSDETGLGGAVGKGNEHMPNYLTVYLQVPDIDAHLEKIGGAGGSTVLPRTEIPDTVTFALFSDPAGNMVGLVEGE